MLAQVMPWRPTGCRTRSGRTNSCGSRLGSSGSRISSVARPDLPQCANMPTDEQGDARQHLGPGAGRARHAVEAASALREAHLLAGARLSSKSVTARLGVELLLHLGDLPPLRVMLALDL